MAILISNKFPGRIETKQAELRGRFLAYTFSIGSHTLTIGMVYAPNEDKEKYLSKVVQELSASQDRAILIGGDLNIVFNGALDRSAQRQGQSGALSEGGKRMFA